MWAVAQEHPEVCCIACRCWADLKAKSDVWSEVMAVPPHGYLPYNLTIPHGGETALMFNARVGDSRINQADAALAANVNDKDARGVSAVTLAEHSGFTEFAVYPFLDPARRSERGSRNGFTRAARGDHAPGMKRQRDRAVSTPRRPSL